jgi:hypothetical protein
MLPFKGLIYKDHKITTISDIKKNNKALELRLSKYDIFIIKMIWF